MEAIILAAGRGTRLQPLTNHIPKPLVDLGGGLSIIDLHVARLIQAGVKRVVINTAWLPEKIHQHFAQRTLPIVLDFSDEKMGELETAGGLKKACKLLKKDEFWVVNGDIACDIPFMPPSLANGLAKVFLANNPAHNPNGDFSVTRNGLLSSNRDQKTYTYTGVGYYHRDFFNDVPENEYAPLGPLLKDGAKKQIIQAQVHQGFWYDIGTLERLNEARADKKIQAQIRRFK